MTFRNAVAVAAVVLGVSLASGANAANLVADGDFSIPSGGSSFMTYNSGDNIGPWMVTSGSVDLVGGYWQNPVSLTNSSSYGTVDLDGTAPGSISQMLNLNPGTYVLNFSLSGNPDAGDATKTLRASIGGALSDYTFVTGANTKDNMGYDAESLVFTISGIGPQTTMLSFLSLDDISSSWGPVIGNVSVSAVPLPAALPLFAAALIGIGAFSFYRRRQSI